MRFVTEVIIKPNSRAEFHTRVLRQQLARRKREDSRRGVVQSMKLVISHWSALRYWRASTAYDVERVRRSSSRSPRDLVCTARDVHALAPAKHGFIMSDAFPLDILVPSNQLRRPAKDVQPHVWSRPIPRGELRRVAKGLYVCSPEFVYLQLAESMDEISLAQLAVELCGTYGCVMGGELRERFAPLTSVEKLKAFLEREAGARGSKKALHALNWAANGSASPRETTTLLALCLPMRWGGYGLPIPQLNQEIQVGKRLESYVENGIYRPDFLWLRELKGHAHRVRVTGEYDSHEYHDAPESAEHTRIRRNDFKTMGYLETSINKSQLSSGTNFEVPARQIARDLGIVRTKANISTLMQRDLLLERLKKGLSE